MWVQNAILSEYDIKFYIPKQHAEKSRDLTFFSFDFILIWKKQQEKEVI